MKTVVLLFIFLLTVAAGAYGDNFAEGKELVDGKVPCDAMNESQLEIVGEYMMEQMHPGDSHEMMHQMMGMNEGEEDEEEFHRMIAQKMYCNAFDGSMKGMMGMMGKPGMDGGEYMMQRLPLEYEKKNKQWRSGHKIAGFLFGALVLITLIQINLWLYQQIKSNQGSSHKKRV